MRRPARSTLLYGVLCLLMLGYVGVCLTLGHVLRGARIDLTSDRLYTLSGGTQRILADLHQPIQLTLYFSEHATPELPQVRGYERRVRDVLTEMEARSHGKLQLQVIDPVPYSDDEATAESGGLTAADGGSNGERVFFGLLGSVLRNGKFSHHTDDSKAPLRQLSIPFFEPAREGFLEYDLAKLIYELNQKVKPHIGVISSLPVMGNPEAGEAPWTVIRQLTQRFAIEQFDPRGLKRIGDDIQVLLLIHPKKLPDDALYAIEQYVLRGGHLAAFVDPDAELDPVPYLDARGNFHEHSSDLPRLLDRWGVLYDPHQIVLDRARALQIEFAGSNFSHPAMLGLIGNELNRNDVATASLQRLNLSTLGHFDLKPNARTRLIPLLQSSPDAHRVPLQRVLDTASDPSELLQGYRPDDTHYVIAARLRGQLSSAFPERQDSPNHLKTSGEEAEVILVADTDLLSDRLWVDTVNFLGQSTLNEFANNGDFIGNLLDSLSGASTLLGISRHHAMLRPFTRVQALQVVADRKFLFKKQELERELNETRSRLRELQSDRSGHLNNSSIEQKQEIEQFLQRRLAINRELREVQRQLNQAIDLLGWRLEWLNIALIPSLLMLLGIYRLLRRGRRRHV